MQDFRRYNYNLTISRLEEIQQEYNGPITVIINGEYYNLIREPDMSDCTGDCDGCRHKKRVPGDIDRIDREPRYFCDYEEGRL